MKENKVLTELKDLLFETSDNGYVTMSIQHAYKMLDTLADYSYHRGVFDADQDTINLLKGTKK